MLGPDKVRAQAERLLEGGVQDRLGAWRDRDRANRGFLPHANKHRDLLSDTRRGQAQRPQDPAAVGARLLEQTQQQVLGTDVVVAQRPGLLFGDGHDLASRIGQAFEHARSVPPRGV